MRQLLALILVMIWGGAGAPVADQQTWTGTISDSQCGINHEGELNETDCTLRCIQIGFKYVLVADGKVLKIANQDFADLKANAADTFTARKADFAKIEHILGDNVVVYMLWADNVGMAFNGVNGIVTGNGGSLNYADQARNVQVFAQWSLVAPK